MKKIFITAVLLFLAGIFSYGQYQVKTKFTITNEVSQKYDKLIFGIHQNASDSVDLSLGENYDLPPNPPQSELYGNFYITNPRTLERTGSYLDLRGLDSGSTTYKKFTFRMQRGMGSKLFIKWFPFTTEQVDSAFLTDNITENVIKIDMIKKDTCIVDNPALNQFLVKVWYKNPNTSVSIDNEIETISIKDDIISINNNIVNISIYNLNGNLIINQKTNIIDFSSYKNGLYFADIQLLDGKIIRKKILKF